MLFAVFFKEKANCFMNILLDRIGPQTQDSIKNATAALFLRLQFKTHI